MEMEPAIVRAFLYRMLSPNQREKLMLIEMNLPPPKLLQGFEICRLFRLEVEPVSEKKLEEMNRKLEEMKRVLKDFEKILWKERILDYKAENPHLSPEELADVVDGKIGPEDWWRWQAFALEHYQQPSGSFRDEPAPGVEFVA